MIENAEKENKPIVLPWKRKITVKINIVNFYR